MSGQLRLLRHIHRKPEFPEDGLEALWAEGIQQRLPFNEEDVRSRPARRLAVLDGFSLHADTYVHARDRKGLERLCRYGDLRKNDPPIRGCGASAVRG